MKERPVVSLRVVLAFLLSTLVAACLPSDSPVVVAAAPPASEVSIPAGNWRAVLVAGDSSSPAFNNGVETMRDRLRGEGVHDIRVLSADPAALGGAALANPTNLRRAMQVPGGGACLVYMTSHGDERGFFLQAGRALLLPSWLEDALDAGCGGLPTVAIVSACHSGVFLTPQLRKPNRIVLTAAAADRASFGCGAEDEYTFYDRCLLRQLDNARTWRDLAVGTRDCVVAAERELGVTKASQPQIFIGSDVAGLRLPGR